MEESSLLTRHHQQLLDMVSGHGARGHDSARGIFRRTTSERAERWLRSTRSPGKLCGSEAASARDAKAGSQNPDWPHHCAKELAVRVRAVCLRVAEGFG